MGVSQTVNLGGATQDVTVNVGGATQDVTEIVARTPRTDATNYNVLAIVLDDFGPDRVPFMDIDVGAVKARMPFLTSLAEAGVIFDRAEAAPICGPARAQFYTGRYAHRTGMGANSQLSAPTWKLNDEEVFFAQAVRFARGYSDTSALYLRGIFGKYHVTSPDGYDTNARDHGFNRGHIRTANAGNNVAVGDIDHFIWSRLTWNGPTATPVRAQVGNVSDEVAPDTPIVGSNTTYDTDDNWAPGADARALVAWANANPTRALVMVWTPNAPHEPYQCPPFAYISVAMQNELTTLGIRQGESFDPGTHLTEAKACFLASIEAIDFQAEYIFTNLDPQIVERMMTLAIGDNGTVVDMIEAPFTADHAKRTAYRQGCIVPCFAHGPLVGAPGRRSLHAVQIVDFWPTILDIVGGRVEHTQVGARTIDGISFFPVIRNPNATPARTYFLQHSFGPNSLGTIYPPPGMTFDRQATRDWVPGAENWSYVKRVEGGDTFEELYQLTDEDGVDVDPWEQTNLNVPGDITEEQQAHLDRLRARMVSVLESD